MPTYKKKDLNELVGGDVFAGGNDRNPTNDSEIETGPPTKDYSDDSEYEKGEPTTGDKTFGRYVQDIPWFAVYSYGAPRTGALVAVNEKNEQSLTIKKKTMEEKIEDLVKKSKSSDLKTKDDNPKLNKILDLLDDNNFTTDEISKIKDFLSNKKESETKSKQL